PLSKRKRGAGSPPRANFFEEVTIMFIDAISPTTRSPPATTCPCSRSRAARRRPYIHERDRPSGFGFDQRAQRDAGRIGRGDRAEVRRDQNELTHGRSHSVSH